METCQVAKKRCLWFDTELHGFFKCSTLKNPRSFSENQDWFFQHPANADQ
jgi:hypothetical protein